MEELDMLLGAVRIGPDRLRPGALAAEVASICWVAYWYRDHRWCTPGPCPCGAPTSAGQRPIPFGGGEGVAIIARRDGRFGLHAIRHGFADPAFDWDAIGRGYPTLSLEELTNLRRKLAGTCPAFDDTEGNPIRMAAAAAAIWEAFDAALERYGLPDRPRWL